MSEKMQTKLKIENPTDVAAGSIIAENLDWEPEEEAAVRRKFDFAVTPLVTLMYMLCAIDRNSSNLAPQPMDQKAN